MSEKVISSTTQEFLDVYDIVNNTILLKDGTASIILQVGTMNFSLLAEQEQDAIMFTYGSLLNSLNYPIQISIQSQTKDVTKYLRLLDEQIQKASSDRKANLIKQYRDFVATLIKERNVLEKRFYVTIPASPAEMGLITPTNVLPGKTTFDINTIEKSIILEKAANLLEPRRDHLISQFNRLGLYTRQLNTQEIIQNFYINYNPEAAEGQEISNNENYTTSLVRASFGEKIMQNPTPQEMLTGEAPSSTVTSTEPIVAHIESTIPNSNIDINRTTDANQIIDADPTINSSPIIAPEMNSEQNSIPELTVAPESAPVLTPNFTADSTQATILEAVPDTTINQVPAPELVLEPTPTIKPIAEPTTESILNTTLEPSQSPDVNLTLNSNLVPEPTTSEATSEAKRELESAPVPTSEPNPGLAPIQEQNDFTEEIAPLQSQFEQVPEQATTEESQDTSNKL